MENDSRKAGLRKGWTRRSFIVNDELVSKFDKIALNRRLKGTEPTQKKILLAEAMEYIVDKYSDDLHTVRWPVIK